MEEKIIIDKKCKNYWNGNCSNNKNELIGACDDYPNCYYKQLKRLEQENEELKARLRPLDDSYFNSLSSIEIAGLAKKSIRITTYNRQLETALEEIREISQFACEKSICHKVCQMCSDGKILKIITEAIG